MQKAIALFDGQNLFHMTRHAFGDVPPHVNPSALALKICERQEWHLVSTKYYTGIHSAQQNAKLNAAIQAHLGKMRHMGVSTFSRTLRYQNEIGQEKGVDMRIALDAVNIAYRKEADIILLFSQDQDFVELAKEIRLLNTTYKTGIKIASAFPESTQFRGIDKTDWIRFSKADYTSCLF